MDVARLGVLVAVCMGITVFVRSVLCCIDERYSVQRYKLLIFFMFC